MIPSAGAEPAVERCLRCSAAMEWRHGTWQCPRCRFKLGCCEGESPESCEPAWSRAIQKSDGTIVAEYRL